MQSNAHPTDNSPWNKEMFLDEIRCSRNGSWHSELRKKFNLHPVVLKMLDHHRPLDVPKLVMEWPHVSESDITRLAYTRNENDGMANRQLVTSIGKFIARHWPHISDHLRRDATALFTPDKMYFVRTIPEIIEGIELGPHSCMASRTGSLEFTANDHQKMLRWLKDKTKPQPDWLAHPYCCYDPALGWHMALRRDGQGTIVARAMCYEKMFVRTYRGNTDVDSYSHADEVLAAWLKEQGYEHEGNWPEGTKLRCSSDRVNWSSAPQCPYLDGDIQRINHSVNDIYIVDESGRWECDNQNGHASGRDSCDESEDDSDDYRSCDGCGNREHEDNLTWIGRNQDSCMCESCLADDFRQVRGTPQPHTWAQYMEYWLNKETTAAVHGTTYFVDEDNLPNGVVQLIDGDYAEVSSTVLIDGEYYLQDDEDITMLDEGHPDTGEMWALKEDTWVCFASGYRYHNDTDGVEMDGNKYHPDRVPAMEEKAVEPAPVAPATTVRRRRTSVTQ